MAKRIGYSQVEPNHMSGMVTGQILAQLPVDTSTMGEVIEQGRFAKYDYANNKVNLTGAGEWMMIYNEEKLYDERKQSHKDFAMVAENYTEKEIVPRLFSVLLGDVWTTNTFEVDATNELQDFPAAAGEKVYVKANGYLTNKAADKAADSPEFEVAKVYTLADGQPAVKLMKIK